MSEVRTKSGWLGDEVGTWVSYDDYKKLEATIKRIQKVESSIRHGWSFCEDPRSKLSVFRRNCADKILKALEQKS